MKMKIMVVDDSLTIRKIIINVLMQLGIDQDNIGSAKDGMDALGQLKSTYYDLGICQK